MEGGGMALLLPKAWRGGWVPETEPAREPGLEAPGPRGEGEDTEGTTPEVDTLRPMSLLLPATETLVEAAGGRPMESMGCSWALERDICICEGGGGNTHKHR
jgi:hypothetical protein